MQVRHCALLRFLLVLVLGVPAYAAEALHFEQKACELTPPDGAFVGEASFPFVNSSAVPVTILFMRASCSCITPHVAKQIFQPGEHGEIHVDAIYGSLAGLQKQRIEVVSDHPDSRSTMLTVVMHLPPGLEFTPAIVHWKLGEKPGSKHVQIKVPDGFHHRLTGVDSSRPEVSVTLVEDEQSGPHVEVGIHDTATPLIAFIHIQADNGKRYVFSVQVDADGAVDGAPVAHPGAVIGDPR